MKKDAYQLGRGVKTRELARPDAFSLETQQVPSRVPNVIDPRIRMGFRLPGFMVLETEFGYHS